MVQALSSAILGSRSLLCEISVLGFWDLAINISMTLGTQLKAAPHTLVCARTQSYVRVDREQNITVNGILIRLVSEFSFLVSPGPPSQGGLYT